MDLGFANAESGRLVIGAGSNPKLFSGQPAMTSVEVAAVISKTPRTIELASAKLVKEGKLKFVGPKKGGHWEVLEKTL